ncbi:PDxFFG protein [Mycoplasmopsis columbinasalis]|uniref:Uncharacterized protein n=1 Tax=Mycoplasmopsis columbinasalis TaxID=114880 RepID=A0A449BAH1_9BACT|nr:PDxFFG protein [Mycoplasmopsis columbinasalis]VEU78195.1 Uncharacterised protein [Mycoplasmopsis columbinasalis]
MKKFNFKTLVWPKYVLSAGILAAGVATALSAVYLHASKSDEKTGKTNPVAPEALINRFVSNIETDVVAKIVTKDHLSEVASYDFKNDKINYTINGENKSVDVDTYLADYFEANRELPSFQISYGTFNFFNDYIESISAAEFFKFTQWFMQNVSWGPEIITLKSFSLVRGVEHNGNAILLGQHEEKNKEITSISFFVDAFFGSLPIYSTNDGPNNHRDSLTYKLNKNELTATQLQEFLSKINDYNSYANVAKGFTDERNLDLSFRTIANYKELIGTKVWAVKVQDWTTKLEDKLINTVSQAMVEQIKQDFANDGYVYLLLIDGDTEDQARANLQSQFVKYVADDKYNLFDLIDINTVKLEEKSIFSVSTTFLSSITKQGIVRDYLKIFFQDGSSFRLFDLISNTWYETTTDDNVARIVRYNSSSHEYLKLAFDSARDRFRVLTTTYNQALETVANKLKVNAELLAQLNEKFAIYQNTEGIDDTKVDESQEPAENDYSKTAERIRFLRFAKEALFSTHKAKLLFSAYQLIEAFKAETFVQTYNTQEQALLNESTERRDLDVRKSEFTTKINEIYTKYWNDLALLVDGQIDGKVVERQNLTNRFIYNVDLGDLPNYLITLNTLTKKTNEHRINWRDFANLNGFLRKKVSENIVNGVAKENTATKFFFYNNTDEQPLDSLKDNTTSSEIDQEVLINEIHALEARTNAIQTEITNLNSSLFKDEVNGENLSAWTILNSVYATQDVTPLPFNFKLPGHEKFDGSIESNGELKAFLEFSYLRPENQTNSYLELFINYILEGNQNPPANSNENLGLRGILAKANAIIDANAKNIYDALVDVDPATLVQPGQDKATSAAYIAYVSNLLNFFKQTGFTWEQYSNLVGLFNNFDALKKRLANQLSTKITKFNDLQVELAEKTIDLRFKRIVWNLVSNVLNLNNEEFLSAYRTLINTYNTKKNALVSEQKAKLDAQILKTTISKTILLNSIGQQYQANSFGVFYDHKLSDYYKNFVNETLETEAQIKAFFDKIAIYAQNVDFDQARDKFIFSQDEKVSLGRTTISLLDEWAHDANRKSILTLLAGGDREAANPASKNKKKAADVSAEFKNIFKDSSGNTVIDDAVGGENATYLTFFNTFEQIFLNNFSAMLRALKEANFKTKLEKVIARLSKKYEFFKTKHPDPTAYTEDEIRKSNLFLNTILAFNELSKYFNTG